jgi:ankyrin repeat protein
VSPQAFKQYFFDQILHYIYEGDTALHIAAAAYQFRIVEKLIAKGADVRTRNRRGAEPLHYAVDGGPGMPAWKPSAQIKIIARLIRAGEAGADPRAPNARGSTPILLATQNPGRGGSGSAEGKAQQQQILRILRAHGAA